MTHATVDQMKKLITRKEKLIAKHRDELTNMKAALREVCPHKNKETKERYFEGGYLNKAYTEYTTVCKDCGQDLGTKTETHSYYG